MARRRISAGDRWQTSSPRSDCCRSPVKPRARHGKTFAFSSGFRSTSDRGRVERARTRFRSRAFAELVLAESTLRVRTAAWEAARLAELIPTILCRSEARGRLPWVRLLVARATAHRANALRVAGDLPAAEAAFADLRLQAMNQPVPDVLADAEIDSLEASLRFDQRRLPAAEALLQRAERIYRDRHRPVDLGRTLMIKANLRRLQDRPREIEPLLTEAAQLFDSKEPYLYLGTVQGRVNALLELDRPADAAQLLAAEGDAYERHGDDSMKALRSFAAARIALQLQQHRQAEQGFLQVRDQFLALDRDYDAILASLYLADTLLAAGKLSALRHLATDLVSLFQSRGVERETLASLRLLAEAAKAETLSAALLAELRRQLDHGVPSAGALEGNL